MGRSLSGACEVCGADVGELCRDGCISNFPEHRPKVVPYIAAAPAFSHDAFNKLRDETFAEIAKLHELKGGEYSGDDDRLLNFRRNGAALNLPMETIWAVYAAKHWDAVMQWIVDRREGKERVRLEPPRGRVHDLIAYLLLLEAMMIEAERK